MATIGFSQGATKAKVSSTKAGPSAYKKGEIDSISPFFICTPAQRGDRAAPAWATPTFFARGWFRCFGEGRRARPDTTSDCPGKMIDRFMPLSAMIDFTVV